VDLLTESDGEWEEDGKEPREYFKWLALGVAAWFVVSLIVLAGLLKFKGTSSPSADAPIITSPSNSAKQTTGPAASTDESTAPGDLPVGWSLRATDDQSDCSAHSYGNVRVYFGTTPCKSMHRALATTRTNNRFAIIAWSVVTMPDSAQADQFLALVSRDGTGNVADLLRDGQTIDGLPKRLPEATFAARSVDNRVYIAEAAYAEGKSSSADTALQHLADQAIVLD